MICMASQFKEGDALAEYAPKDLESIGKHGVPKGCNIIVQIDQQKQEWGQDMCSVKI